MNTLALRGNLATAAIESWLSAVAVLYMAVAALPVYAHHSAAMFDTTREVILEGIVQAVKWNNPHVWIFLDVVNAEGSTIQWGVEAGNPLDLDRKGWTTDTFKVGDKVKITVHPAKHNKSYGSFVRATLSDGSLLGEVLKPEEIDGRS